MVPDFSKQIQKTMNKVSYIFTTQPPQIPRGYIFFPTEKTLNRSGIPSDMPLIQMGTVAQCNAVVAS